MGKTVVEKIFEKHLIEKIEDINIISLDLVFGHEVTTPPAILDLQAKGKDRVFNPDKIKLVIDHVTPAKDTQTAIQHKILREWAKKHGIKDFFDVGRNGVCHAIFPEKGFVRPGYTIIMGDSHTCTHGAFGAFAAGVGTTDLEGGILKGVCAFKDPKTIKIEVDGKLPKGVYSKDVILYIIKTLGVNGATDRVIEFTGSAIRKMTMDERMTITNMAIEAGGTSGIVYPDEETVEYLWPFIKNEYKSKKEALNDFKKWWPDEDAVYEKIIKIDVSKLEPMITDEYKPDVVKPVKELEGKKVDQVYIGSCTNGRLDDLRVVAKILKGRKINPDVRVIVSPATPKIFNQALKEGIIDILMEAEVSVTNPTCGACLGMSNGVLAPGEVAVATTNRNFNGRMGKGGMVHLASPATAAATAIEGKITDPRKYL